MFMSVARVNQLSEMLVRNDPIIDISYLIYLILHSCECITEKELKQIKFEFQAIFYATKRVESAIPGSLESKVIPV